MLEIILMVKSNRLGPIFNERYGHTAHTFSRLLSDILIWERCISITIRFQMTDNNTFLAVSPADLIT